MAQEKRKAQVVILGAGPGGYAAAFRAADLGLEVTLIDPRENPGGVCLYQGCIPTKTLLHVVDVMEQAKDAAQWGLNIKDPSLDIDKMRKWKDRVVTKLTKGLGLNTKTRKINFVRGTAKFTGSHSLQVTGTENDRFNLDFEKAIIATGVRPAGLPGLATDHDRIMNAYSALELKDIPEHLLVVGAGYIGLEMGVVYQALGSKITLLEASPGIMPGMDRDLAEIFVRERRELLKGAHFNSHVTDITRKNNHLEVSFEDHSGKKETGTFDKVLVAIGEVPNIEKLGLEEAGVKTGNEGFIRVNEYRQTNVEHIYAIGDIAGKPLLAHKASHEGRVAAGHIAGQKVAFEPMAIPEIVYTGLAWVGLTEELAQQQGREVKVVRFPWNASGRATSLGHKHGLTKLIVDPHTERILGAGFAGKRAGSLVAEATLAIEMGAVAKDLELTIHPHPTMSETIMEAAELFYGNATHVMRQEE